MEKEDKMNDKDKKDNEEQEQTEQQETVDEIVSKYQEELDESKDLLEATTTKLLRLQADFTNYKKRIAKEREGLVNVGIEAIVTDILPVLDNFERAMESENDKTNGFYKGIEMIQKQMQEVLEKNGVKEIDDLHKPFDPNYHHAVVMEESEDWQEGIILGILQKGYTLEDKVIRPAMVRVAK